LTIPDKETAFPSGALNALMKAYFYALIFKKRVVQQLQGFGVRRADVQP